MAVPCQAVPTTKPPLFATLCAMALPPEEVGAQIRAALKQKQWTHAQFQDAISERLGKRVNLRTVQRWQKGRDPKTGKSWLPRLDTLMEIADVLGIPRSQLVEEAPAPEEAEDRLARLEAHVEEQKSELAANGAMLSELLNLVRELREARQPNRQEG